MAKLQQYLSDKLKLAKTQPVWLTYRKYRYKVELPEDIDALIPDEGAEAFAKSKFGITLLRGLHRHNNRLRAGCRYLNDQEILGIVTEKHDA